MQEAFGHGVRAVDARRIILYRPQQRPGFVAWVTAFDYGDGRIGISFKETVRGPNPRFIPPRLEMGEAVGAPVSYCAVECGSAQEISYRVYMMSKDYGQSFHETGRCLLEDGSFCNIGFPDGRIVGLDVPRINKERTGWCEGIRVRESRDGGSTWRDLDTLLPGTAPYLWRIRRLRDDTLVVMASLYGTPWGSGKERSTRNTMLPHETYLNKIQTFFLTTKDGYAFTGPHYILPGVGAHEYDCVEQEDGSLLFIAGDVQATPVARQVVQRQDGRFINGTITRIERGAPADERSNPQGGFVPETIIAQTNGLLIGARRNKPYACCVDDGMNWYEIDGLPPSLYQPVMVNAGNGTVINFGHFGGDNAFGEVDMYIGADLFHVEGRPPEACKLHLERMLAPDGSHYINAYRARLTAQGNGIQGQTITFRCSAVWNDDGSVSTSPQEKAPVQVDAVTDIHGWAYVHFHQLDDIPDIHHYCQVDAIYHGNPEQKLSACRSQMMCAASLTPHRRCLYPYDAYFANGTLFLSPQVMQRFPQAADLLLAHSSPDGFMARQALPPELLNILLNAHVLTEAEDGQPRWYRSIHSPRPLTDVKVIPSGDWYV